MKKQRYGGSITWSGSGILVLPKQPKTRRLVWLAALGTWDGDVTSIGLILSIKDGSLQVARRYVCSAALTDLTTFDTMFLFAENVGNDSVIANGSDAQATCSIGRDCYMDAASKLELDLDYGPSTGNVLVTFVFEDVEDSD
jgi:hypothetical protein